MRRYLFGARMNCYRSHSIGFFFQAEDGTRDGHVTGVQTCALPISQFFIAPLILCLAFALGQAWRRTGELTRLTLGGLTLGFAFFIINGTSVALGEVGFLPPVLAAWAPPLLLASLVAHLLLKPEATAPISPSLMRRS